MPDYAIIVFTRNPVLGSVKTRLANTYGDDKALEIYKNLILHTQKCVEGLPTFIYYDAYIDLNDAWVGEKKLQITCQDLGLKMKTALDEVLSLGFKKILLIGSDNMEISKTIINDAFQNLDNYPAAIGPAVDGGYYAIGFHAEYLQENILTELFLHKTWSHANVSKEAYGVFQKHNLKYYSMSLLNDIDEAEDWENYLKKAASKK